MLIFFLNFKMLICNSHTHYTYTYSLYLSACIAVKFFDSVDFTVDIRILCVCVCVSVCFFFFFCVSILSICFSVFVRCVRCMYSISIVSTYLKKTIFFYIFTGYWLELEWEWGYGLCEAISVKFDHREMHLIMMIKLMDLFMFYIEFADLFLKGERQLHYRNVLKKIIED